MDLYPREQVDHLTREPLDPLTREHMDHFSTRTDMVLVIVSGPLGIAIFGALQLRNDDALSEEHFIILMKVFLSARNERLSNAGGL